MATRKTDKQLVFTAILGSFEVASESVDKDVKPSYYSVKLSVADIVVAESDKFKCPSPLVKLEWKENNLFVFDSSSTVKIELYQYRYCNTLKVLVGKQEGNAIDMLQVENSTDISCELKDKGVVHAAQIKIAFPVTSTSGDNIQEFMTRVIKKFASHLRMWTQCGENKKCNKTRLSLLGLPFYIPDDFKSLARGFRVSRRTHIEVGREKFS